MKYILKKSLSAEMNSEEHPQWIPITIGKRRVFTEVFSEFRGKYIFQYGDYFIKVWKNDVEVKP